MADEMSGIVPFAFESALIDVDENIGRDDPVAVFAIEAARDERQGAQLG